MIDKETWKKICELQQKEDMENGIEIKKNLDIRQEEMKERHFDNWKGRTPLQLYFDRKIQTFKLSKEQFKCWSGPIIYICWEFLDLEINSLGSLNQVNKKYKQAIYVGRSSCGISRPTGRGHHMKNVIEKADEIEILPCYDEEDSIELENDLIKYLRPRNNSRQKIRPRQVIRI